MSTNETAVNETEQTELQPVHQAVASESVNIPSENKENEGDYLELEFNGKIVNVKILSRGNKPKDTTSPDVTWTANSNSETLKLPDESTVITQEMSAKLEKREKIFNLMPDSTNAWLYIKDDPEAESAQGCCMTDNMANKMIAIIIIILQIAAYILMTRYLIGNVEDEFESRVETCYGPNCKEYKLSQEICMNLTTGGLMSVLLIGFLWADVVNVLSICVDRINKRNKLHWYGASFLILFELMTAIVCGFLVGLYSDNDFDAIGGAVGILFVHDLDEKVFASMQLFRGTAYAVCKKLTAVSLWVILSITVATILACKYEDGSYLNATGDFQCRDFEYQCSSGTPKCIWAGFRCNGIKDCSDGSDEGDNANCNYFGGLQAQNLYCPDDNPYMCIEDGSCIEGDKQCNGVLDCPDGSDEGREVQDCLKVNQDRNCSKLYGEFNVTTRVVGDGTNSTYFQEWTGSFKCGNGQCIKAEYACDGVAGDCVDGTDEYPYFISAATKGGNYSYSSCPYDRLITCRSDEVLCKIDGQCISKLSVCDGVKDCSDGADEPATCDYSCQDEVLADEKFQCGGNIVRVAENFLLVEWFNASLLDNLNLTTDDESEGNVLDLDPFLRTYPELVIYLNETYFNKWQALYDLVNETLYGSYKDPSYLFEDAKGECIPIQWRCDGVVDCIDGTDEQLCVMYDCSTDQYKCPSTGECIPKSWLCDGGYDCQDYSDEDRTVCDKYGAEIEEITECGQTVSGTVTYGSPVEYSFIPTSINPDGTGIDFDGCESTADTVMIITDSNFNFIAENDDYYGCFDNSLASYVNMTYTDSDTGLYYLSIDLYGSGSGSYSVTVVCK